MQAPNTPFIGEESQARHQAYIQAAEQWRLQQAAQVRTASRQRPVRVTIVQRVIHFGQWLIESGKPATPVEEIW